MIPFSDFHIASAYRNLTVHNVFIRLVIFLCSLTVFRIRPVVVLADFDFKLSGCYSLGLCWRSMYFSLYTGDKILTRFQEGLVFTPDQLTADVGDIIGKTFNIG